MSIVVTGGTGLLGTELKKIMPNAIYLSHKDIEITNEKSVLKCFRKYKPDLVLHLAADVRTDGTNKQKTYDTNVIGTRNVARYCPRLIYLSTEYIFDGTKGNYEEDDYPNPLQFYGLTKLLGEYEARICPEIVIVRCVFKPRPYKHDVVPFGMKTSGDYVDEIAPMIKWIVENFDKVPSVINIGTGIKTLKKLALKTRAVTDIDIDTLPIKIPLDASLNLRLWKSIS
jgi:dTDP-4-dehydrorhamnose reductase